MRSIKAHRVRLFAARASLVAIGALALAACTPDLNGIHASVHTGALLDPPGARGDALASIRDACGAPERPGGVIARHPYVQHVEARAATLAWTSTASTPE
ncbi:MAG: hypothetical protein M3Y87_16290, partial [Myxococcota bacterium]|nr:hypothetical protein [Myxococcota bacterium]